MEYHEGRVGMCPPSRASDAVNARRFICPQKLSVAVPLAGAYRVLRTRRSTEYSFLGGSQWPGDMLSWALHVDYDGYFLPGTQ